MSNPLIHLIATFDHNSGETACGERLDTWTIKYPALTGALAYGYAKGGSVEIMSVNCSKCLSTYRYMDSLKRWIKYINTTDQEIIDRIERLKLKFPGAAAKLMVIELELCEVTEIM